MISSAPPSYATTRSNTLGSRLLSSCRSSFRIGADPTQRDGRLTLRQRRRGLGEAEPFQPTRRVAAPYFPAESAPPANGCLAVRAPLMTASIEGCFLSARSIDSFVAR